MNFEAVFPREGRPPLEAFESAWGEEIDVMRRFFRGKNWWEIDVDSISDFLPYSKDEIILAMNPEGFCYYLPMWINPKNLITSRDLDMFSGLLYSLSLDGGRREAFAEKVSEMLSLSQKKYLASNLGVIFLGSRSPTAEIKTALRRLGLNNNNP